MSNKKHKCFYNLCKIHIHINSNVGDLAKILQEVIQEDTGSMILFSNTDGKSSVVITSLLVVFSLLDVDVDVCILLKEFYFFNFKINISN